MAATDEKLIEALMNLTVEEKLKLLDIPSDTAEILKAKMIIAIDLKTNHISDSRVQKALNNAMREDSQIRELLTSNYSSSEKSSRPRISFKGMLLGLYYILLRYILVPIFFWAIAISVNTYMTDASYYNTLNFNALSFIALSLSVPFLLSKILNIIRDKTEDKGSRWTSFYSGPHIFTEAEIHGDKYFKIHNNKIWRKYYIISLFVTIIIPILFFPQQNVPMYIIIAGTILSPLSFLTPQRVSKNFLVSEETIGQDYSDTAYNLHGTTLRAGMKRIDLSLSFSRDILFGLVYPVLSMYCIYYSLSHNQAGLLAFLCAESIILLAGCILWYSIYE